MRTRLALGLLLTATLLPGPEAGATSAVVGQAAPDFALKDASGRNLRLSEWRGEVVVLSFWAGFCGRCSDQLQELDRLRQRYAADGVRFVAINIDRDQQAARAAAGRLQMLVLHDGEQAVAREYDVADLPLTIVVDAHGQVRHVHRKYQGGDAALYDEELATLLRE